MAVFFALAAASLPQGMPMARVFPPGTGSTRKPVDVCPTSSLIEHTLSAATRFMQTEQYEAAAKILNTEHLRRCDPRIDLLLGAAYEGLGDSSNARLTLQQAHQHWPLDNSVASSLARNYWISGQAVQAAEALASTTANLNTPLQELDLRIEVFLFVHQLTFAQAAAELAYRNYPSSDTLLLLANVIQAQGRAQDALKMLEAKRRENTGSLYFLITIAEAEYDSGLYAEAEQDLVHASAIDIRSYQAHYLLGNTLVKRAKLDAAIAEYQTAIALAPDRPRTYYQLALAKVMQDDIDGAKQALSNAITVDERYAPAYTEMGELLMREGRYAEALEPLTKAVEYGPTLDSPYYLLTRVYSKLGRRRESDEMLHKYQEVNAASRNRPAGGRAIEQGSSPTKPKYIAP